MFQLNRALDELQSRILQIGSGQATVCAWDEGDVNGGEGAKYSYYPNMERKSVGQGSVKCKRYDSALDWPLSKRDQVKLTISLYERDLQAVDQMLQTRGESNEGVLGAEQVDKTVVASGEPCFVLVHRDYLAALHDIGSVAAHNAVTEAQTEGTKSRSSTTCDGNSHGGDLKLLREPLERASKFPGFLSGSFA